MVIMMSLNLHDNGVYKLKKENAQLTSKIIKTNKDKAIKTARESIR